MTLKHMLDHSAALDRVFRALSDPTRRALVERLQRRPASVSELAAPLPMTLAAVVQHLQLLEESGLVRSAKAGRVRVCALAPEGLAQAESWLSARRALWSDALDRLGDLLAEDEADEGGAQERSPSPPPRPKAAKKLLRKSTNKPRRAKRQRGPR